MDTERIPGLSWWFKQGATEAGHHTMRKTPPPQAGMKVGIEYINSAAIRAEMRLNHYTTAEVLGTYQHPFNVGSDWVIRLYRAADQLVFDTNADPVWESYDNFHALAAEYGINLDALKAL
jgi:hypothetical protein